MQIGTETDYDRYNYADYKCSAFVIPHKDIIVIVNQKYIVEDAKTEKLKTPKW